MTTPAPALFPLPDVGIQVSSADQLGTAVIEGKHFAQVRNVLQIPFDDSVDATHALECFFQMPTNTLAVRRAQVWVERKSFRAYSTAVASGGGSTSGSGGAQTSTSGGSSTPTSAAGTSHTHSLSGANASTGTQVNNVNHSHDGGGNQSTDHSHIYVSPAGQTSGGEASHTHTVTISGHTHDVVDHTHTTPAHAHDLSFGIFEQASSADFSVDAADDGTTYVEVQASTTPPIVELDITSVITRADGDKRIRINSNGLARCQVLILLDLVVGVAPGGAA